MAGFTPELIAHIRRRYEHTDDTLAKISVDCGLSERTLNRMRDREGWSRRSDGAPRGLPPAARALDEAAALLAARVSPPPKGGRACPGLDPGSDCAAIRVGVNARDDTDASAALGAEPPLAEDGKGAIERIERLVQRELAAEEAVRAQLGPLPRPPADAERAARTLATLTQTLHALQRLRCGLPPDSGSDDNDDMPRDIDEFRRELARRIDASVASRTGSGNAQEHARPDAVDETR